MDITDGRGAQKELRRADETLERQIQQRTAELTKSNAVLQAEIVECRWAEQIARGQIEALTKTLKLLAAEPEREKFIGQVLKAITEQLGAQSGGFWFWDHPSQTLSLHLNYEEGQIQPVVRVDPFATAGTAPLKAYDALPDVEEQTQHRGVIVYDDIADDPRLARCRGYLLGRGVHTLCLIPLFLEDELIGSFSIQSTQSRSYRPEEIELAQALAQQAVLAIQLARLAEHSRQAAVLEERNRLAREIHDTLAQAFTGILIQLGVAQRIAKREPEEAWNLIEHISELAREGLTEARRSVWALQPDALEYSDLASALPRTVAQMTADVPLHGEVHIHGTPRSLPSDVGMNLLRIAQEALNNAIRHARAQNIFVELTFDAEQVRLCVQDDGQGFDPQHQEEGGGFGLIGMRQRAERIGGQLTLASLPGQGTEVAVAVRVAAT